MSAVASGGGGSMSATASVYPVFDIGSISEWCNKDVDSFITQETNKRNEENIKLKEKGEMPLPDLNLDTGFALTTEGLDTKEKCVKAVEPFVEFINVNLQKDEKGESKTYVDAISGITDTELQNKLWIARTFMFSQLMIFAVVILGKPDDGAMYKEVFGEPNGTVVLKFMSEVAGELPNYQMGIFGSKSPTSDIDVGIQYTGGLLNPTLHYILSVFENLFLIFTGGKSSLDFDIEAYADLYLIKGKEDIDYFYLDTANFELADFVNILPVAGMSIARNVLMDNTNATPTFDNIISDVNTAVSTNAVIIDKNYGKFQDSIGELLPVLTDSAWLSSSMDTMKEFLDSDYDGQRAKYYQAVFAAETMKFAVAPDVDAASKLTNEQRCKLINLVGTALAYRMESYSAAPTITHVVRIIQANSNNPENANKYATKSPTDLCSDTTKSENSAYCAIGKYGFVMSILEQMGYMFRFYKHYCVGEPPDQAKCNKKMKKYGERYVDGFSQYQKYIQLDMGTGVGSAGATKEGGKRRRTRRGTKVQRRKTSKRGRTRKNRNRK